jgi:hypothetical protein
MQKLFVFYIGGTVPGCHLELHDIRFAVGATAEDCWDTLRAQWWGTPDSLHLDAWGALTAANGYDVEVRDSPQAADERLFFVHLGGYDPTQFTELHANSFRVAVDARQAKRFALREVGGWASPHRDAVMEVDSVIDISGATAERGAFLHLTPRHADLEPDIFAFETGYVPIGRMQRGR